MNATNNQSFWDRLGNWRIVIITFIAVAALWGIAKDALRGDLPDRVELLKDNHAEDRNKLDVMYQAVHILICTQNYPDKGNDYNKCLLSEDEMLIR